MFVCPLCYSHIYLLTQPGLRYYINFQLNEYDQFKLYFGGGREQMCPIPVGHYRITLKLLQITCSYFLTMNIIYSNIISHYFKLISQDQKAQSLQFVKGVNFLNKNVNCFLLFNGKLMKYSFILL